MKRHRLKLISLLLGGALLIGLTCAGSRAGSNAAPSIGELTVADVLRLAEVEQVLARFGNEIWPGWSQSPPLLLRKGEFDYLIGHPNPPETFEQIPGASIADRPVFRRKGHLVPVPAATTWEVTGVWCVAAHESFHAFTIAALGGVDNLPDFGPEVDSQRVVDILAAIPDLDVRYAAEGQALRDGITAGTEEDGLQAAAAFLQVRQSRRANHPDLISFERTLEWTEGLACYADVSLMQLAGKPAYTGMIHYPNSVEAWQEFLTQLSDPASIPTGLRDRYAILGAGEAFLLDRLMPDWKAKAIPGKIALEELLVEAAGRLAETTTSIHHRPKESTDEKQNAALRTDLALGADSHCHRCFTERQVLPSNIRLCTESKLSFKGAVSIAMILSGSPARALCGT